MLHILSDIYYNVWDALFALHNIRFCNDHHLNIFSKCHSRWDFADEDPWKILSVPTWVRTQGLLHNRLVS